MKAQSGDSENKKRTTSNSRRLVVVHPDGGASSGSLYFVFYQEVSHQARAWDGGTPGPFFRSPRPWGTYGGPEMELNFFSFNKGKNDDF